MIYIRYTISKISFSYIMFISIILCRNYLQIVKSNYVYFGQINESVCLSVCLSLIFIMTTVIFHTLFNMIYESNQLKFIFMLKTIFKVPFIP